MIEAPDVLQSTISIPPDHLSACYDRNIATIGNAAGNTRDFYDLAGENLPPPPPPSGFTSRGIVALVFSCLSAIMGMAVIAWYGLMEFGKKMLEKMQVKSIDGGILLNLRSWSGEEQLATVDTSCK